MSLPLSETLVLTELAEYLRLPPPALEALVARGVLPGERAGGRWRFRRSEVDRWLDLGMPGWDASVHPTVSGFDEQVPVTLAGALRPENVLLDVDAPDWRAAIEQAVAGFTLPPSTDRRALARAILEREQLCSTALDHGFALPHTRRTGPRLVAADLAGFVRLTRALPPIHTATGSVDLLWFIFARDPASHLRLLARATRLAHEAALAASLRAAGSVTEAMGLVSRAEERFFGRPNGLALDARRPARARRPASGDRGVARPQEGAEVHPITMAMLWDRLNATYCDLVNHPGALGDRSDRLADTVAHLVASELARKARGSEAQSPPSRGGAASARVRQYAARVFAVVAELAPKGASIPCDRARRTLEEAGFNRDLSWRFSLALRRVGLVTGEPSRPYLDRRGQLLVQRLLAAAGLRTRAVEDLEAGLMIAAESRLDLNGRRLDAEVLSRACAHLSRNRESVIFIRP